MIQIVYYNSLSKKYWFLNFEFQHFNSISIWPHVIFSVHCLWIPFLELIFADTRKHTNLHDYGYNRTPEKVTSRLCAPSPTTTTAQWKKSFWIRAKGEDDLRWTQKKTTCGRDKAYFLFGVRCKWHGHWGGRWVWWNDIRPTSAWSEHLFAVRQSHLLFCFAPCAAGLFMSDYFTVRHPTTRTLPTTSNGNVCIQNPYRRLRTVLSTIIISIRHSILPSSCTYTTHERFHMCGETNASGFIRWNKFSPFRVHRMFLVAFTCSTKRARREPSFSCRMSCCCCYGYSVLCGICRFI